MSKLKRVVIERSGWYRGATGGSALLVTSDMGEDMDVPEADIGKKCCLGFVALACGFKSDQIEGVIVPSEIPDELLSSVLPESSPFHNLLKKERFRGSSRLVGSRVCCEMVSANDNSDMEDADRETTLQKLGAKAGFELVFED